jgi:hypothetical protein
MSDLVVSSSVKASIAVLLIVLVVGGIVLVLIPQFDFFKFLPSFKRGDSNDVGIGIVGYSLVDGELYSFDGEDWLGFEEDRFKVKDKEYKVSRLKAAFQNFYLVEDRDDALRNKVASFSGSNGYRKQFLSQPPSNGVVTAGSDQIVFFFDKDNRYNLDPGTRFTADEVGHYVFVVDELRKPYIGKDEINSYYIKMDDGRLFGTLAPVSKKGTHTITGGNAPGYPNLAILNLQRGDGVGQALDKLYIQDKNNVISFVNRILKDGDASKFMSIEGQNYYVESQGQYLFVRLDSPESGVQRYDSAPYMELENRDDWVNDDDIRIQYFYDGRNNWVKWESERNSWDTSNGNLEFNLGSSNNNIYLGLINILTLLKDPAGFEEPKEVTVTLESRDRINIGRDRGPDYAVGIFRVDLLRGLNRAKEVSDVGEAVNSVVMAYNSRFVSPEIVEQLRRVKPGEYFEVENV